MTTLGLSALQIRDDVASGRRSAVDVCRSALERMEALNPALNAFNLGSSSANRDLGVVILGSVYPTRREAKFTFPLYLGGGYLLGTTQWFFMLGPGIGVRL